MKNLLLPFLGILFFASCEKSDLSTNCNQIEYGEFKGCELLAKSLRYNPNLDRYTASTSYEVEGETLIITIASQSGSVNQLSLLGHTDLVGCGIWTGELDDVDFKVSGETANISYSGIMICPPDLSKPSETVNLPVSFEFSVEL